MTIWAPGSVYACCLIKITSHTGVIKENQFPNSFLLCGDVSSPHHSTAGVVGRTERVWRNPIWGPTGLKRNLNSRLSSSLSPRLIEVNLIHNSARHVQLCDCSNVMKNKLQSQSLWWRFNNSRLLDQKKKAFYPVKLVMAKGTTDKIQ